MAKTSKTMPKSREGKTRSKADRAPVVKADAAKGTPKKDSRLRDGMPSAKPATTVIGQMVNELWQANPLHNLLPLDWGAITDALATVATRAAAEPERTVDRLMTLNARLCREAAESWADTAARWLGGDGSGETSQSSGEDDRRFDAAEWRDNPYFRVVKQTYQAISEVLLEEADRPDLPADERQRLAFHLHQLADATSPTLFLPTNPAAQRRAFETGGMSIVEGLRHLAADLEAGRLSMTDTRAFEPGRNLALTPGKVVYRNRLIELIQYAPTTDTAFSVPLLFLPPWINKYYVLDLQPKNSMVRYLVEQGFTVFMISWKNPDASMEDITFDDYMSYGPLAASEVIREITGAEHLNAVGYCIGGTLLAMTLAYLAAKDDHRFGAATLMVSLQDFSEVGDTALFLDEPHVEYIEREMMTRGYLDSRHLSDMFNLLRSNDLIWNTVVNNYLMGNSPPVFDLLYWNADGTRMARGAHSFYLRNTYVENNLIKPGAVSLKGIPIDLGRITQHIYAVGAETDHIVPWRSAWRITRLAGGQVRFVLAASGHIAGMINPPAKGKGGYWLNDKAGPTGDAPSTVDEWLSGAARQEGSWWTDWTSWLSAHSGERRVVPTMGSLAHPPLCDAPGSYVLEK